MLHPSRCPRHALCVHIPYGAKLITILPHSGAGLHVCCEIHGLLNISTLSEAARQRIRGILGASPGSRLRYILLEQ